MTQLFEKTGTNIVFAIPPAGRIKLGQITGHTDQLVTEQGKNLFNPATGTIIVNGVTCSVGEDGTITLDGTATEDIRITLTTALVSGTINPHVPIMILEQGKPYVFSETIISGTATGTWRHVIKDKDGDNLPDHGILDEGHSSLITAGTAQMDGASASLYPGMVYLYATSGAVFDNFKYRIQFEQSESVTPWEQFVPDSPSPNYPAPISGTTALTVSDGGSNSQIINLPQPLYSLPDGTADIYDMVSGNGTQNIGKAYLDGGHPTWFAKYDTHCAITFNIRVGYCGEGSGKVYSSNIISDKFIPAVGNSDKDYICDTDISGQLYCTNIPNVVTGVTSDDTDEDARTKVCAWFVANPVTVLYELATPQEISGMAIAPFTWLYREAKVTAEGGTVSLSFYNEWTTPKTDWKDTDYFNLDPDYARIKSNIEYIKEFSEAMYDEFSIAEMDNFTIDGFPADTFLNNIVDNVTALENSLFKPPADQPMQRYSLGAPGWDYRQLNIIENNIQHLHDAMVGQWNLLPTMAFSMGTGVDEF